MFTKTAFIKQIFKGIISISILVFFSCTSFAEEDIISFHGEEPSSDDLLNAFTGEQTQQTESDLPEGLMPTGISQGGDVKYRGISLTKSKPAPKPASAASAQKQQTTDYQAGGDCIASAKSVAVDIRFNSNSSTIKSADYQMLKKIAKVMNAPQLLSCFFVIEGHTDAVGNDYYNLWLSQKRADSVKNQLSQYNVAFNRMIVVGKGEDELLDTRYPNSAKNRRVQFRVINPGK